MVDAGPVASHVACVLCPYCRQDAPLIYRGVTAYCTACGRQRQVFSGQSVTLAGKTGQLGGVVVRAFGYIGLTVGLGFSLFMALIVALVGTSTGALITGGVLAALTLLFTLPILFGGKKLEASGENERDKQRIQAVFALAANRGGVLRAKDAAQALDLSIEAADAFLTDLAKKRYDDMNVDISEQGEVIYTFPRLLTVEPSQWGSVLGAGRAATSNVRVAAPTASSEARSRSIGNVTKSSSAPPPIIDADFEEIDEPAVPARNRA